MKKENFERALEIKRDLESLKFTYKAVSESTVTLMINANVFGMDFYNKVHKMALEQIQKMTEDLNEEFKQL